MASLSRLKPGEKGRIQVTVDAAGKRGPIVKTVQVYSNDPKLPVVSLQVSMQVRDSVHLKKGASAGIFDEACRSCHVDQGRGKTGFELFRADCFMCHNAGTSAQNITQMSKRPESFLRRVIRDGVANSTMPGFSQANGGPLTEAEIDSLVKSIRNP
ncbi:MAG: hypothetical protein C0402_14885 [Thermodesulfovibrio sp.]|nr:hypothetical protein [Thermodesulfovibrio sp.]